MSNDRQYQSCPTCKKVQSKSDFSPFCSERCQTNDLGDWLSGKNALPSNEPLSYEDLDLIEQKLAN